MGKYSWWSNLYHHDLLYNGKWYCIPNYHYQTFLWFVMIKNTFLLFLNAVDRDIEMLEAMPGSNTITDKLRQMQDNIRSNWARIYSNEKRDKPNSIESFFDLNIEVNGVFNSVVADRANYILDNEIDDDTPDPITEYILNELFISYTIFLDAYTEMGLYYVICGNFPFHNMNFFSQQKAMREANRRL